MKTIYQHLITCITFLILVACNTQVISPSPEETPSSPATIMIELDQPFTLYVGQHAKFDSLQLTVIELRDIRCPSEVLCAEKGFAQVWLEIVEGEQPAQTYLMNSDPFYQPDMGLGVTIITHNLYTIELTDVYPYPQLPEDKIPLEEYQVTFVVSKRG